MIQTNLNITGLTGIYQVTPIMTTLEINIIITAVVLFNDPSNEMVDRIHVTR